MSGTYFGDPFVVILSIFCAIILVIEEENERLDDISDPDEAHYRESKKAMEEAMKLPPEQRIEYFKKGIYDRIHKRMLDEISRRK